VIRRVLALGLTLAVAACTVGDGEGSVQSPALRAAPCFEGPYNLQPTFFGSNPYRNTQTLRVQRGDDLVENSDGIEILVDDTARVRASLGQPLKVGLSVGVAPPGVPLEADPDPPIVHVTLYLHQTCHGENIALYGVDGTITFTDLFIGDREEDDAADKLTEATFDIRVGDPRLAAPGERLPPEELRSSLTGRFRFYFERAQGSQPFP
jgi:hypothetical protein